MRKKPKKRKKCKHKIVDITYCELCKLDEGMCEKCLKDFVREVRITKGKWEEI